MPENNQTDVTDTPAAPEPAAPEPADAADSAALLASITAERDRLASERSDYYERLLRTAAEFENFRRRSQRERAEFVEFAGMEVVRELLPVLDDFERALKLETADKEYRRGVELIYGRLLDALKKAGLEPLVAEGQKFDPHLHHAVERAVMDGVEEDTVVAEHQRGYNFKGRPLRPAMVKVAVKP
jgi:molecular chaperone GrpE